MRTAAAVLLTIVLAATQTLGADNNWYTGDEHCPPPKDDGTYSAPYNALEYRQEYPTFSGADKPGWSCSYQREDGVIVQYGDSRTPQQQWLAIWGDNHDNSLSNSGKRRPETVHR
jgi:hypothetical protein